MVVPPRTLGWRWWAAVLSAAILLRALVALVLLGGMPMVSDARDYYDLATRLAAGDTGGAFYWPPGESIVLACAFTLLESSLLVARVVTIATSVAGVVLTALLARDTAPDTRAGRLAGWMAAAYGPSVLLCGQTYAQHLSATCVAAVAWFGLRAARERRLLWFALTGVAFGLGCLTRPSMASLAPVLAVGWALVARRGRAGLRPLVAGAALAGGVALCFILPAQAHDARAGAGWTVSTNNERNLFLGNNPYTPDYKTSHLGQRSLDELEPDARGYLQSFYARPDARTAMQREALDYMLAHPLRTAWRTLNRATSFWGFDYLASREIQRWRGWTTRATVPLLLFESGSYLVVAVLAVCALFALRGVGDGGWRAWLVALALAYEAPYALAFSGGTYHFPVIPLVLPLSALALVRPAETWKRVRESRAAWAALGLFAVVQLQYAYYALTMS